MTSSKNTKRALLASVLSVVLCCAMLIGSTFAWFTDSVTSTGNKIVAGNLKVDLVHVGGGEDGTDVSIKENSDHKIFDYDKWEPGYTVMETLKVVNKGNLAFKFRLDAVAAGATAAPTGEKLADVIDVYVYEGDGIPTTASFADLTADDNWRKAGSLSTLMADPDGIARGVLLPKDEKPTNGEPVEEVQMTVALHMQEDAGNAYQGLTLGRLNFTLMATQYTYEEDGFGDDQYDKDAAIKTASSLEELFPDVDFDFGFNNVASEPISLDGKGVAFVDKWTDAWLSSDTTIKGVTFKNGAVFSAKADNITVTLEDCTFYACDQTKLVYTNNNSLTNSGAGMCLNLEKSDKTGVKFIVKNCKFIGENDPTLPVDGPKYEADGSSYTTKKRGHAIALDAICGGGTGTLDSLLIEGCTIDGVRGHAIQLYGNTGDITIKNTNINSWGVNRNHVGAAIRGDYGTTTSRTITLENVYFGLNETGTIGADTNYIGHVYVGEYPGNTDGSRTAGTYYSVTP